MVTRAQLIDFLRKTKLAVEATVHGDGRPQAPVIGIAVTVSDFSSVPPSIVEVPA